MPWFGRFTAPDPARDQHFEDTQSWNIYSYVRNSPIMHVDPTGMEEERQVADPVKPAGTKSSGPNPSRGGSSDNTMDWVNEQTDPAAQKITPKSALDHYKEGSGTPLRMSFQDVDTSAVTPTYFNTFNKKLATATPGEEVKIDAKQGFSTGGAEAAYLGNITLRMQGVLSVGEKGTWSFKGTLKAYDDVYDFNQSNHRSVIGELSTAIGARMQGKPYDIQIRGEKPMQVVGQPRDPMDFPRYGLFTY